MQESNKAKVFRVFVFDLDKDIGVPCLVARSFGRTNKIVLRKALSGFPNFPLNSRVELVEDKGE